MKLMHKRMARVLSLLAIWLAVAGAERIKGTFENIDFEGFKLKYGKSYGENEEVSRYENYVRTVNYINKHNAEYDEGKHGYWCGLNKNADMSDAEYEARNGDRGEIENNSPLRVGNYENLAETMDWRERGAVSSVKDQGHCGSCWAFGATGALEGQQFINYGNLPELANQQLVSCDTQSSGCNGGLSYKSYRYVAENNGIDTDTNWPYTARDDPCDHEKETDGKDIGATSSGEVHLAENETALKEGVANVGPIQVSIYASLSSFKNYAGGVYDDPACVDNRNHAVLVVGYGELDGRPTWIIKNSWGQDWGDKGYIQFLRDHPTLPYGMCGLAHHAYYPAKA